MTRAEHNTFIEMDNAIAAVNKHWMATPCGPEAPHEFEVQVPMDEIKAYWMVINRWDPAVRAMAKESRLQLGRERPSGFVDVYAIFTYSMLQTEVLRDVFLGIRPDIRSEAEFTF